MRTRATQRHRRQGHQRLQGEATRDDAWGQSQLRRRLGKRKPRCLHESRSCTYTYTTIYQIRSSFNTKRVLRYFVFCICSFDYQWHKHIYGVVVSTSLLDSKVPGLNPGGDFLFNFFYLTIVLKNLRYCNDLVFSCYMYNLFATQETITYNESYLVQHRRAFATIK